VVRAQRRRPRPSISCPTARSCQLNNLSIICRHMHACMHLRSGANGITPSLIRPASSQNSKVASITEKRYTVQWVRLVLGIWAGLFGPARARPENKSPKHGPARNNMGRASTARRRAWAGPQILTRRAPSTARIDGPGLGRHGPIKPNLFNLFNLVR
jgi:hypothetical protein